MIITVDLLSNGQMKGIPKTLNINEWTLSDIKDLSKAKIENRDEVFNSILSKSMVREGLPEKFSPENLCEQDRMFIMLSLRMNSVGPLYTFEYSHSVPQGDPPVETCGEKIEFKIDLQEYLKCEEISEKYKNHIAIELPVNKDKIRVCIPSWAYTKRSQELYAKTYGKEMSDFNKPDTEMIFFWVLLSLSGVNDTRFNTIVDAINWADSLSCGDTMALFDTIKYFREWGPELTFDGICPKCKRRYLFRFPIIRSFFFDKGKHTFDVESAIKNGPVHERQSD